MAFSWNIAAARPHAPAPSATTFCWSKRQAKAASISFNDTDTPVDIKGLLLKGNWYTVYTIHSLLFERLYGIARVWYLENECSASVCRASFHMFGKTAFPPHPSQNDGLKLMGVISPFETEVAKGAAVSGSTAMTSMLHFL